MSAAALQRRATRASAQKKVSTPKGPRSDYSQFSHRIHVEMQKLACDSCHKVPSKNWKEVRKGEAAFLDVSDFPDHSSCLNCHRKQFFARERPAPLICANCHVNNSPRDTSRYLFPSLGDVIDATKKTREFVSEFGVAFPHDKHIDVVGLNGNGADGNARALVNVSLQEKKKDATPASCPVCHQTYQPQANSSEEYVTKPPQNPGDAFWLKKGTFKTIPNSHALCFTCHSSDSGIAPAPKDCNVCHKLLSPDVGSKVDFDPKLSSDMGITDRVILARWSKRISAGAFRHEGGEHPDLSCIGCHHAGNPAFNTLDAKTLKVPVRSCGGAEGCHVTATTDDGGILNFEIDQKKKDPAFVCTKCHISFGKESIPENHPQAIPASEPRKPST
ncbi:MAG: cytochrome c3 family protein [bacterium]